MRKISSNQTFWYKKIFPVMWFGFLTLMFATIGLSMQRSGDFVVAPLIVLPVLAIFGYCLMRVLVFDLADEVWDDDNSLVVKNGTIEERIPLSNIANISYQSSRPPRATLTLGEPCRLGKKIVFSPLASVAFSFSDFPKRLFENQIVNELIERVAATK